MRRFLIDEAGCPIEQRNGALARRLTAKVVVYWPVASLNHAPDMSDFFSNPDVYLTHSSMGEWNIVPSNDEPGFKVLTLEAGMTALQKVSDYRTRRSNATTPTALSPDELNKIVVTVQDFRALLRVAREDMQREEKGELKRKKLRVSDGA